MPYSSVTIDPYVELDVRRDASLQEIKQAYRRIALSSHPDHHRNDADSAERFRRASQAYALLRDPERRLAFDRTGRWDDGRWEPAELDVQLVEALEIFAHDFGAAVELPLTDDRAPAHTGRVTMTVDVKYEEVERGARRRIPAPCAQCAGSGGREGSTNVRCTSCGGSGRLRQVESSFLGPRISTERCESCHGSGRRPILVCPACDGTGRSPAAETMDVLIPRGAADGDHLTSVTANGYRFIARLVEDQRWAREGADLYAIGRMPYGVAVLGGTVEVELPARKYRMTVAAGTASGHRVRIPGQGLPLRDGTGRGNLILTLHVAVPDRPGTMERWLLRSRATPSMPVTRPGFGARVGHVQARARETAAGQWRQWRAHHHQSSLLRIEKAAASLRSAAGRLSVSEERVGSLLEQGFQLIAPEAALARSRLAGVRVRRAALAKFVVDTALVMGLAVVLWLLARYVATSIAPATTAPGWNVLRKIDPVLLAVVPLVAGLTAGALRNLSSRRWIYRFIGLPIGMAISTAGAAAAGTAIYAAMRVAPEANITLLALMSVMATFAVALSSSVLFLLGDSIVDSARLAVQESRDHADRQTLKQYDDAAARLATHLERTELAFRQLLTQADDARHPLTSLLNGAADTLAGDHPRFRSSAVPAALDLAASVAVMAVWIAATALAVVTAFTAIPEAGIFARLAVAITTAGLCAFGSILSPLLLQRYRTRSLTTGMSVAAGVLAIAAILTAGPGTAWLAGGAATVALALSFRLPEAMRATSITIMIVAAGALGFVLWPFALTHSALHGGAPDPS